MLLGGTLALERDSPHADWFKRNHPKVRVRLYDTTAEALDGVARGETVAYAGNRAVVTFLLEREMLTNLRMQGRLRDYPPDLALGVRRDWPEAATLLDRDSVEMVCPDHPRRRAYGVKSRRRSLAGGASGNSRGHGQRPAAD